MYEPVHFEEHDREVLHALIRAFPLGLLISAGSGELLANPVPFLTDPAIGENGVLRAHLARANPQWRHLQGGAEALVVFQGEGAYVTPSWYASKSEHGKVVPTWNFVTVQVRGSVTVTDDPAWLSSQIAALTEENERGRTAPWAVSDAPADYIAAQMRAIIGIEIAVTSIRGKWKLSQNRPVADRQGVADGFANDGQTGMADLVRRRGNL